MAIPGNLKWLHLRDNQLTTASLKPLYCERNGALTIYLDDESLLEDDDEALSSFDDDDNVPWNDDGYDDDGVFWGSNGR
ncbi:hypothetical protein [uncultured Cardiobacterium sp.]|uniref:hypothetical protein n=1 Tax=uncultured Cardiobacterium sp. TaxID=417619 RepID=UPI002636DBF2|nr:hypothetical protein [uncultured Cardiobacterium sp.]